MAAPDPDNSTATGPAVHPEFHASPWMDWVLLLLPGLIWGASFLFIAEGLQALEPDGVTFARFIIGFITLSLFPGARRPIRKEDRMSVVWLGVIWMAVPMSMFPHAEQYVSSALTGMLNGAIPLIATAVAALLARTWPSRAVIYSLLVGFTGAVLLAIPGFSAGRSSARGVLMILFALVCYGISLSLARPLQQRNGALPVVWRALAVALVLTAPLGLPALLKARWTVPSALCVLALGALGTAIANAIMAVAAGRLGATRASATAFLIPVVALLLGVLVRDERVPALALCGGALCLAGAALIRRATMVRTQVR